MKKDRKVTTSLYSRSEEYVKPAIYSRTKQEKAALKRAFDLRIGSCLACVYRVTDAGGKFGEHERSVRVARGDSREQL